MGQITIRNLDDAVIERLRKRAAAGGRSMEEEARQALSRAVGVDRESLIQEMMAFQKQLKPVSIDSVEIIREMREMRGEWSKE